MEKKLLKDESCYPRQLEHIARAVWFRGYQKENLLVSLTAYFDESGTDAANPALVVAGFASTVDQWDRFSDEWGAVQEQFQAPPFHAKHFDDARRGFGPWAKWEPSRRNDYLNRLLGIIARRTNKSFATMLDKSAYEALIAPRDALREYFYAPYTFASANAVLQVLDWRNDMYAGTPLLFIFNQGHKNLGELLSMARRTFLAKSDRMVQDLKPGDDEKLPPLQAADLLAFELCSEWRSVVRQSRSYSRYPLLKLDEHPHEWLVINQENLLNRIADLFKDGTFRFQESIVKP